MTTETLPKMTFLMGFGPMPLPLTPALKAVRAAAPAIKGPGKATTDWHTRMNDAAFQVSDAVRQQFWANKASWPRSIFGKVFLGEAVLRLGHSMFPDQWTGYEPTVSYHTIEPLPLVRQFMSPGMRQAEYFAFCAASGEAPIIPTGVRTGPVDFVDDDQWERARALRDEAIALVQPIHRRLAAVHQRLWDAFLEKTLTACALRLHGGEYSEDFGPAFWNAPYATVHNRLTSCGVNIHNPMEAPGKGEDVAYGLVERQWLFVDGKQLGELCRKLTGDDAAFDWPAFKNGCIEMLVDLGGVIKGDKELGSQNALIKKMREEWCVAAGWEQIPSRTAALPYARQAIEEYNELQGELQEERNAEKARAGAKNKPGEKRTVRSRP